MALGGGGGGGVGGSAVRAGKAFVEISGDDAKLQKALDRSARRMKAFGANLQQTGMQMLMVGVAAATPLALATKTFMDFDDQMRAVKAVTGASAQDFERLTNTAKELGRTTSFTASEVGALMLELARAGFSADEIDGATESVLALARATGTEAALSAKFVATSIRQFGLEATEAARVADAFTIAANKSLNTVELLGDAMSYAGPVAADLGLSLEDTLALLGALGNVGIQGSNAGTAMRRLGVLTAAESDKLRDLFGVEARGKGLVEVMAEIGDALDGLAPDERTKKLNDFFGLLGITSASALSKNAVGIRQLQDALARKDGVAVRTAKEMDAGIGGAWRIFLSAVEGVAIAIGESLVPVLSFLGSMLTGMAGKITSWVERNRELVAIIGAVVAGTIALGGALLAAGLAAAALGAVLSGLAALAGVAGAVLGAVFSPFGIAIAAAIAQLVILGYWFATLTDTGRAAVGRLSGLWGDLKDTAVSAWGGIVAALRSGDLVLAGDIAMAGLRVAWSRFALFASEAWVDFKNEFKDAWDDMIGYAERALIRLAGSLLERTEGVLSNLLQRRFGRRLGLLSPEEIAAGTNAALRDAEARRERERRANQQARQEELTEAKADLAAAEGELAALLARAIVEAAPEVVPPDTSPHEAAVMAGFQLNPGAAAKMAEIGKQIEAATKGTFVGSLGNFEQSLGVGDQVAEKQLEKLAAIAKLQPQIKKAIGDLAKGLMFK